MSEPLTPEQIAFLASFADNAAAGRRVLVWTIRALAALGAFAMFVATFLYFATETWKNVGPK